MVIGVREINQSLERWEMNAKDVHRRMILAPTPRERVRWHAVWLLAQDWTASATAEALERDPHTIGRWAAAFGEGLRRPPPVAKILPVTLAQRLGLCELVGNHVDLGETGHKMLTLVASALAGGDH